MKIDSIILLVINVALQISYVEYSIPTRSLDIFTTGCDGSCEGCCNPEIKSWDLKGESVSATLSHVISEFKAYSNLIDKIIIVGGDPCDAYKHYPEDMTLLLKGIKDNIDRPIFLFTRHEFDNIPDDLKAMVDYVKTGAYVPSLTCDNNIQEGIKLATSNQKIWKVS